jgi:hypothetical protein
MRYSSVYFNEVLKNAFELHRVSEAANLGIFGKDADFSLIFSPSSF